MVRSSEPMLSSDPSGGRPLPSAYASPDDGTTIGGGYYVISHRIGLDDLPDAFKAFRDKKEEYTKVVVTP